MSWRKFRTGRNPLLPWTALVGVAFCLVAWLVYLATVRRTQPRNDADAGQQLMQFFETYGVTLLAILLVLLAVSVLAAIRTDRFWTSDKREDREAVNRTRDGHRDQRK